MPRGTWWTFAIRLFYAGAMEGQMPEILTMIQVSRMTPTPAVLCIAFLSLLYLGSDNVFSLINYVGFATWVQQLDRPERPVPPISLPHAVALFFLCFRTSVEHRCGRGLRALFALEAPRSGTPHSSQHVLPHYLHHGHGVHRGRALHC